MSSKEARSDEEMGRSRRRDSEPQFEMVQLQGKRVVGEATRRNEYDV